MGKEQKSADSCKIPPPPEGKSFEIRGSKLKPLQFGNLGQTSVLGIMHGVFFGIGKDPFNNLLLQSIEALILRCICYTGIGIDIQKTLDTFFAPSSFSQKVPGGLTADYIWAIPPPENEAGRVKPLWHFSLIQRHNF